MCNNNKRLEEFKKIRALKFKNEDDSIKEEILRLLDNNPDLGTSLKKLGLTENDLNNPEYWYKIDDDEINKFSSNKENFKIINLYKYTSPVYGTSNLGPKSRNFCKILVARTKTSMFTYKDILSITPNPGFGKGGSNIYSVFRFRGGSNCKHVWTKFKFDTTTLKLVKAPVSEQPIQINPGSV